MEIKYKPTKQKKEKPFNAPKAPKADKPMSFGSAKQVKIDKPQKVKEPKTPKAFKPEKTVSFAPTKPVKVQKFEKAGKLKQPVNPKILAAVASAVVVVLCVVVLFIFIRNGNGDDPPAVKPESLIITALPEKTTYYVGEVAVFSDMKLKVTLTNGVSVNLKGSDCEISGFDSSVPAERQTITVKYKDLEAAFDISVKKMQSGSNPSGKVSSLTFKTLPKTEYKVGDWPSVSGGVLLLNYEDGSSKEVELTYDHIFGFTTDAAGTYTVTVKHEERGMIYETTYDITVTG